MIAFLRFDSGLFSLVKAVQRADELGCDVLCARALDGVHVLTVDVTGIETGNRVAAAVLAKEFGFARG